MSSIMKEREKKMEKIEKDIALLSRIQTAEVSPYLLNKIHSRIEQLEQKTITGYKLVPLAVGFVLLILVNFYAINQESNTDKSSVSESSVSIYESNQLYYD